ncbi:arginine/serine-rich coiled-coil protein 2-like isoform X2 [Clytia hemisphaerica]|uniref:arginine/serine-rich coiled-coil protein 2-like isoform X2 n=1 Tax=Clytia hemisphaerica TaxID=252671 RepID=UPI0034D469CC
MADLIQVSAEKLMVEEEKEMSPSVCGIVFYRGISLLQSESSPELPSRLDRIPSPSYGAEPSSPPRSSSTNTIQKSDKESANEDEEPKNVKKKSKNSTTDSRSPRRRSRSRSPKRKRSRSRDRDRRRKRSRTRSKDRRRRSRSRSRDRRSRSRDRRRSRSRSRDRRRSRSPRRKRRSRSRSPRSKRYAAPAGVCRAVIKDKFKPKEVTTEEIEARLKEHMKTMQEKQAEEAKKINLPTYLNPNMVNVQQFKQVQDKRKLLWSKPKDKKEGAAQWSGAFDDENNDEKFKRLMGIQGVQVDESAQSKVQESRKVLDDLEKEYEKSRAFQMSRGAGGLTGMGLGFGNMGPPQ